MIDRPRAWYAGLGVLCFLLFAAVATLVTRDWSVLADLDAQGKPVNGWASDHDVLVGFLRVVEVVFSRTGMTIATVVLALLLFLRNQRRAAYFTVGVMVATAVTGTLLKNTLGRDRPDWQDPVDLVSSHAFPSGHSWSVSAFAGIVIVLVHMFVRRRGLRLLATVGMVLVVLVVWADRVLLGRHYPSDVVAGGLLGAGMVLVGLAVYPPQPRGHAETAEPLHSWQHGVPRVPSVSTPRTSGHSVRPPRRTRPHPSRARTPSSPGSIASSKGTPLARGTSIILRKLMCFDQ